MRTTRVVLVFFSAGFIAGSFEQAAGVGQSRLTQEAIAQHPSDGSLLHLAAVAPIALVPAALPPEPATLHIVPPTAGQAGGPSPLADRAFARVLLPDPEPLPGTLDVLAGLGVSHADLKAMAFGATGRPMSLPGHAAWTPLPSPPFVSLPQPRGSVLPGVPGASLTEDINPPAARKTVAPAPEFILPIHRGRVTSMWNQGRRHPAIDLAAPLGTPVRATTRRQKVTYAGWRGGYGNLVTTRDPQGREHYYGHLQRIIARIGTLLEQGDLLGLLGSTGHSTGPHVHYEVRTRGRHANPAGLLFPDRRVGRGYAWNEGSRATTAVASASDTAQPTRAKSLRVGKARSAKARVARTRRAGARIASARSSRIRITRRARATRVAARYAPRQRYVQPQRMVRYAGRNDRR